MLEILSNPWPWYVAGPLITLVMVLLILFGVNFGVSNNFRTLCAIGGGERVSDFFKIDWKGQMWNIIFLVGAIVGGFIAESYLMPSDNVLLAEATVNSLEGMGFSDVGSAYLPSEIFGDGLTGFKIMIMVVGGFLVGFGARYAGGCTSGHAISGLSDLQLPSLLSVIGFFIGGLIMVHLLMPLIFN